MNYVTDRATDHTTDCIITTEQLTKKYKNFTSVNNVSLHIRKGSIYGFLGPNGAGKSTTMKMLLGLTKPTSGSFTIDGKHFPADRLAILKEIGSFIESPSFYSNLTGRENLDIIRRILKLPKSTVDEALELVGLTEFGDRLAKKYSLGMKQRLGLAGALLGRPPILILDEPTNGLDPSGIHEIRNLVKSLPTLYDCTVLISSHMLSEIELMADDIGILNHGRLLFEGSLRRYADCMNRNWHLNLPETDVEIYVKNSGASFTGDGIRYHILQYDEESADIIIKSFDWEAGELNSELADKMDEWLDSINVPSEDRPKQNEWKHTTLLRKEDNRDHLIMFFDEDTNQLYVVEYFL